MISGKKAKHSHTKNIILLTPLISFFIANGEKPKSYYIHEELLFFFKRNFKFFSKKLSTSFSSISQGKKYNHHF